MLRPFRYVPRPSMTLALVTSITTACSHSASTPAPVAAPDTAAVMRDVRYLASDALEGRGTGTAGNDSAAAYIARRFSSLGLTPAFAPADTRVCVRTGSAAPCDPRFVQPFVARSVAAAHAGLQGELPTENVAAVVRGTDPALRDEYVILGAHFDHLGRSTFGALDPNATNAIHNGADDNASGTAAVMELARLLRRNPPKRSVMFVTFSGEELGLLGSQHFVDHSPVPLQKVRAMLNFDMVGRMQNDRVIVYGFGASDQTSFYTKNLPVLHFFTNVHEDYHKATDDADKVNAAGIARVVSLAERVTRDIADRAQPLTFVRTVAAA